MSVRVEKDESSVMGGGSSEWSVRGIRFTAGNAADAVLSCLGG